MQSAAATPKEYLDSLPPDRKKTIAKLRTVLRKNLPKGFKETMSYGMLAYVVPLSRYPAGYHCKADTPLPFINLASQKNSISLYHMGIYSDPVLMAWFKDAYKKHTSAKLDIGKSCIRFKKQDDIPFALIGELAAKVTPDDWIKQYEAARSG